MTYDTKVIINVIKIICRVVVLQIIYRVVLLQQDLYSLNINFSDGCVIVKFIWYKYKI